MARRKRANRSKPKTVLRIPDLEQSKHAVLNSLPAAKLALQRRHAQLERRSVHGEVEKCFMPPASAAASSCADGPRSDPGPFTSMDSSSDRIVTLRTPSVAGQRKLPFSKRFAHTHEMSS